MKTRVLLGMPLRPESMGKNGAFRGYYKATQDKELTVIEGASAGSLLNYNFNILLAQAYNTNCDYLALIHDDICPQPNWLDTMLAVIQEKNLDALSAVSPIRSFDGTGKTSTAYTYMETDTGMSSIEEVYHLSMRDVMKLPKTFNISHVKQTFKLKNSEKRQEGYTPILLINTGLLVMRLNNVMKGLGTSIEGKGVPAPLCFHSTDTIAGRAPNCKALVFPEDWTLSMYLAPEAKTPYVLHNGVAATRAVELYHGNPAYNNHMAWGTAEHETTT